MKKPPTAPKKSYLPHVIFSIIFAIGIISSFAFDLGQIETVSWFHLDFMNRLLP